MLQYLSIALGGALGTLGRFWLSGFVAERAGTTFPLGTLLVNISGCLVIGFFSTLTAPEGRFMVSPTLREFVMLGICGGYTTFSSFSLQTLTLARNGEWLAAGANTVLSVALCFAAVWLGHVLALTINRS
ncbi:MAG: fluoride efflux transporter CrcB [Chthoniobacteraceae bacterium]